MKLISLHNQFMRIERDRLDRRRVVRLQELVAQTFPPDEAVMARNGRPCRCGAERPYEQRLCEQCLLADAEQYIGETVRYREEPRVRPVRRPSPEPSAFARAFRVLPADNPQGTRMVELRLQGQTAREHGDAAIRHGRQARFTLARALDDSRQAHGIDPTGALAIACLMVAAVFGLLWMTLPDQPSIAEQPATVSPTMSAW